MLISVIIPTCHRNGALAKCLDSLSPGAQAGLTPIGVRPDYEVVVTDDGGERTAESLVLEKYPWAAWTRGPRRGPAANRNHGARKARAEWVAFIDDDCVADPGWLAALAAAGAPAGLDVIEGKTVIPDERDNPFLHGVVNVTGGCYWTCNLAVRRKAFLRIDGFDEEFMAAGGEDMEFAWRFKRESMHAVFRPDALVLHPQRAYSLRGFVRRIWEAKWALLYRQKTEGAPPDSVGKMRIAMVLIERHLLQLARNAVHRLRATNAGNWRTNLFYSIWPLAILPLQLPYLVWWEFEFRGRRRKEGGAA